MSSTETTSATGALPAAWYRDPSERHERRWWDGEHWTDRVADGDQEASDPPVRSQPVVPELTAGVAPGAIEAHSSAAALAETETQDRPAAAGPPRPDRGRAPAAGRAGIHRRGPA